MGAITCCTSLQRLPGSGCTANTPSASARSAATTSRRSIAAGHDARSHVQRVLDAIEAVLEKRATLDQEQYRINNRELRRTPIADLLKLRDRYRGELARMKAASKGGLFGVSARVVFR